MPIDIVPIGLQHVEGFYECLDTVAREQKYLAILAAPPLEQTAEFVRRSVAQDSAQFVAVDGERVVGWADIFPGWGETVAHCGRLGIGLLPAYRHQGLGRRLLATCMAKAVDQGITRIELQARADNHHAIALYEKVGFVHEATRRRSMRFSSKYFDTVQMVWFSSVKG